MAIAFVQATSIGQSASASTLNKAFASNNTAGNCLVVGALIGDNTKTVSSITDSQGNTGWAQIGSGNSATLGVEIEWWACPNCKAGANTVTVTWSGSAGFPGFVLAEYSGVATSSPSDATPTTKAQTSNTTSFSASAVTTATDNALVLAVAGFNTGGTTATGTGSTTVRDNDSGGGKEFFYCDLPTTTHGSYNTTASLSPADQFFVLQIALKPDAGGGGGGTPNASGYYGYYYRTVVQRAA